MPQTDLFWARTYRPLIGFPGVELRFYFTRVTLESFEKVKGQLLRELLDMGFALGSGPVFLSPLDPTRITIESNRAGVFLSVIVPKETKLTANWKPAKS